MLLTWVLSAAVVVVILFTPTYLQKQFAVTPSLALQTNSLAIVALTFGCVVFGAASDKFGTRITLCVGCLGLLGSSNLFFSGLPKEPAVLAATYTLCGFFVGTVGAIPHVLVRAFPPPLRFSGLSFSYNVAYAIFGGLTPVLLTLWLKSNPLAPGHYVALLSCLGVALAFVPLPKHT
jgi:MFS family permease